MDQIRVWRWDDLSELGKQAWKYSWAKKYLDFRGMAVPPDLMHRWVEAARAWRAEVSTADPRDLYERPDGPVLRARRRKPRRFLRATEFSPETRLNEEEAAASIASWDALDDLQRDFCSCSPQSGGAF